VAVWTPAARHLLLDDLMGWTYPYGATRRQIIDELTTNRAT
jgi:hypothetical protein